MQIVAKQTLYKPQKNVRLRTNHLSSNLKNKKKKLASLYFQISLFLESFSNFAKF